MSGEENDNDVVDAGTVPQSFDFNRELIEIKLTMCREEID